MKPMRNILVQLRRSALTSRGRMAQGSVVDLPGDEAAALISRRHAVEYPPPKPAKLKPRKPTGQPD